MSYEDNSIAEIMHRIGKNEIFLPAIQRKFIWHHQQIISLFDSIMRGYPIGTFLFWSVEPKSLKEYTFYKYLPYYHERDKYLNDVAQDLEKIGNSPIIGVLDGQQRLSSMYIARYNFIYYRQ